MELGKDWWNFCSFSHYRSEVVYGLKNWIDVYSSKNNTNKVVAASFVLSAEFKSRYGENVVTTGEYVTIHYRNVYDRLPDKGGFNYWVGSLNKEEQTRSDVLLILQLHQRMMISLPQ